MATKIAKSKKIQYWGTGRRKKSIARVRVLPNGNGSITINGRDIDNYFNLDTLKYIVRQRGSHLIRRPNTTLPSMFTAPAYRSGGAIRHGISLRFGACGRGQGQNQKGRLPHARPRMKERKKYGLHKARKAPQFSKR